MEDTPTTLVSVIAPHPSEVVDLEEEEFEPTTAPAPEPDLASELAAHIAQSAEPLAGAERPYVPECKPFARVCVMDTPPPPPTPYSYRGELDAYTLLGSLGGAVAIGVCLGLLTHWAFSGPKAGATCTPPISSP